MQVGLCEGELRRPEKALVAFEKALALDPGLTRARAAVIGTLMDLRRYADAASVARVGLAAFPDPELSVGLVSVLLAMGDTRQAAKVARDGCERWPSHGVLAASLASTLEYDDQATPAEIAEAHRGVGRAYALARASLDPPFVPVTRRVDTSRPLRVGVLSPDLRVHSVAFFIEPFFELHDRARIELVAFSNSREHDAVSKRLQSHAHAWHTTADLTDLQLAHLIRDERIDVLLDLAGLTINNRLPCLSLRPAPVQATYCGYPDTTGLDTVDYRIVDSHTDPDTPEVSSRATERLLRLDPCFLCYKPPSSLPAPARRNAGVPGAITLGCFNASKKITAATAAIWSRLMAKVPGANLVLKSYDLGDPDAAARVRRVLGDAGIDQRRVEILPVTTGLAEHLEHYARVDVALDPFPYNGTTTTCESLLMGVPTICLEGARHASRVGVSLLRNVGVPELLAGSPEQYVQVAADLVTDPHRLDAYRATLREMLLRSPLCDARAFVDRFERALHDMAHVPRSSSALR
jgi:predicted O-linked N-acetylglucosamine transferase (SPINDLY family)